MEEKEEGKIEVSQQDLKKQQKEDAVKIAAFKKSIKEENEFLQLRVTNMELQVKLYQLNNAMNKIELEQELAFKRVEEERLQQETSKEAPLLNLNTAGLVGADGSPLTSGD